MTTSEWPGLEQFAERRQQLGDVVEVQAGGRLVQDVEQAFAAVRRQVRRNLDPLRFPARQRRRRLTEAEVAEPDLVEHLQPPQHLGRAAEERQRLAHGQVEHLVNRSPAVVHLEHLRLEALAVALIARDEHVGEKLHLDADFALALTRLAAAAGHVEREVARRQPARPRVLGRGEQLADRIEGLQVRHRIRSRRPADGRLIDEHGVGDVFDALELAERADAPIPAALRALDGRIQHVVHERGLARSADARHHGQGVERDADVDVLEVVLGRAQQLQLLAAAAPPGGRHANRELLAEIFRRQRARLLHQAFERSRVDHATALLARAESQIDDVIGDADHVGVVLDDDHGVALVAELPEDVDEPLVVARVQADRRLVEHVERADQRRAERRREVDALRLAARERGRQAVERQVVEADVAQERQPARDFLQHLLGDRGFLLRQLQRREELLRVAHGERRHAVDRLARHADVARLAAQPRAAAIRAGQVAAIPAQEHADVDLVFLPLEPAEESADAPVTPRRRRRVGRPRSRTAVRPGSAPTTARRAGASGSRAAFFSSASCAR